MRAVPVLVSIAFALLAQACVAAAEVDPQACLMMVVTRNTDPAREDAFNDWYDRIDIPDVFTVPGYERARRGRAERVPAFPAADLQPDEGPYVALYDIRSDDLNRTIIDMMLLAQRMPLQGRDTDLLKVTERIYFHRYRAAQDATAPAMPGAQRFLYVVKVDCCADPARVAEFDRWYDGRYLPAALQAPGFRRATRYRLHRVVMPLPVPMPQFLTVFEIEAASADAALAALAKQTESLRAAGAMSPLYAESGATIYALINDVARPPAAAP